MELKRVYHPETNEPFDVTVARADKLVLQHGWLQTPIDPKAEPAVTDTPKKGKKAEAAPVADDWRGSTDEDDGEHPADA